MKMNHEHVNAKRALKKAIARTRGIPINELMFKDGILYRVVAGKEPQAVEGLSAFRKPSSSDRKPIRSYSSVIGVYIKE